MFERIERMNWPPPLLQPDPQDGCVLYSVAYLCHCLGYTDVTPEQVQEFRGQENKWEGMFPKVRYGIAFERFWDYYPDSGYQQYWLGDGLRDWVEQHLQAGKIGLVSVERVVGRAHAIVALESRGDAGIFVCDPLYGHRVDTWEWFLSVGPGHHSAHHIEGWYQLPWPVEPSNGL